MKKLFVVSDIHSFYSSFKNALDEAGFDPNNEEHWLISIGDAFDRGDESAELFHYLMSLERKILIKGNHDLLLDDCCRREFPTHADINNGTKKTIDDIGGAGIGLPFDECCRITWNKLAAYRDSLVNYFETENYIFVHSWLPTTTYYNGKGTSKPWYLCDKHYKYNEDWRNATESEWEDAMWGNPFLMGKKGLNQTGKTIVFGHWHCSYGHMLDNKEITSEFGPDACWDIYRNSELGIIGIDKCTAYTKAVNVLVLEDNFLND